MKETTEFDVIIIGAGLSGINAAYRLQTELPDYNYTILESRQEIGGTWSLFRYPGIRSDSDLHTFGFPWRPWQNEKIIADGALIKNYIKESAEEFGIDGKIQYDHKLVAANWSSDEQSWSLSVEESKQNEKNVAEVITKVFKAKFVIFSTGYYDYNTALKAEIPNIDSFKGVTVHPQFWPVDLDHSNKKIIIIGSGATAATLLPELAKTAAFVTMVQRSPSYFAAVPTIDKLGESIRGIFPTWLYSKLLRWKHIIGTFLVNTFCAYFPNAARKGLTGKTAKLLPKSVPVDPHFTPSYNPWEQRLCVSPDGDFFTALKQGKANIVTDTIKTVNSTGLITSSGVQIDADIIVTATGLKMMMLGGAEIIVDGKTVSFPETFLWRSTLIQNVPNAAVFVGYSNASWTLGSDTGSQLICRVLKHMRRNAFTSATPTLGSTDPFSGDDQSVALEWQGMCDRKILNLSSTYFSKAKECIPKAGDRGPWQPRSNYFSDAWGALYGSLTQGIRYEKFESGRKDL
ncbi:hypothetical protein HYFRA_00008260 [Hymenoscyphus fraxineus]|uniref:Monooxygenase n=1 Tax=Hymenoscyphus fraxineus TaxID=746836 RepID=A0A9N9LA92_9HELO|nr:hypothetical protein HYFRA_00008260 [Hymenoscyphus fraxineus]